MTTEIIILAQGVQSRLPDLTLPKQWLPLPACANTPILHRTLAQIWALTNVSTGVAPLISSVTTIICGPRLDDQLSAGVRVPRGHRFVPKRHQLGDPGNSSLKGINRALDCIRPRWGRGAPAPANTVVLLGDVVYSWQCLMELMHVTRPTIAGTSDLSPSGGELWGVAWPEMWEPWVWGALDEALDKHPPFKEYQCGQLRRWYWAMRDMSTRAGQNGPTYVPIDDYTDDIDVPADVANLPAISAAAAADDASRGITWLL